MDEHFAERAAELAPEYGNVMTFLLHLANAGDEVTEDLFKAAITMTDFSYWKLPSCTLAQALISKLVEHPGMARTDPLLLRPVSRTTKRVQRRTPLLR